MEEVKALERLQWCTLEKAADAVLCQIFAFLNVREHWKFSRTSSRVSRVSCLPQASPQQVDVSNEMRVAEYLWAGCASYGDISTSSRILKRLINFRPLRLTVRLGSQAGSMEILQMTQLRELTFSKRLQYDSYSFNPLITSHLSQLTQLKKLKIFAADFHFVTSLPSSLNQIDLLTDTASGFLHFESAHLLGFTNLQALEILHLPMNRYYGAGISEVGARFPSLKELSLGFIPQPTQPNGIFQSLEFCASLTSLSLCVDSGEFIFPWQTLSAITSLRKLSIYLFHRTLPATLFDGLAKIEQLTYLKIAAYGTIIRNPSTDISDAIHNLTAGTATCTVSATIDTDDANAVMELNHPIDTGADTGAEVSAAISILPNLNTLLISDKLYLNNASCLSSFGALTELGLPSSANYIYENWDSRVGSYFPKLPHLRTLHVAQSDTNGNGNVLDNYKNQVTEVVLLPLSGYVASANVLTEALTKMDKLASLKLHPDCVFQDCRNYSNVPTASAVGYFRSRLPTTRVEIDDSIDI